MLTDGGYVLDDLELSGCRLDSPKRQAVLSTTLNGFGVQLDGGALSIKATSDSFPLRKHNLVQAMLAVNDLFYLTSPASVGLFHEDVVEWLDRSEVRYTPRVKFTGKSSLDHRYDFVIPQSTMNPERLLQTINRPDRSAAESVAFSWTDVRAERPHDARAYAILNDSAQFPSKNVLDALRSYDVHPVLWSSRDQAREELAA